MFGLVGKKEATVDATYVPIDCYTGYCNSEELVTK